MAASQDIFKRIDSTRIDGRCENIIYRQKMLLALHKSVKKEAKQMVAVLNRLYGNSVIHAYTEVAQILKAIQSQYESLGTDECQRGSYHSMAKPCGTVLVIVDTTINPFFNALSVLASAIVAGNTCVLNIGARDTDVRETLEACLKSLDHDAFVVVSDSTKTVLGSLPVDSVLIQKSDQESSVALRKALLESPQSASTKVIESYSGPCCAIIDRTANAQIAARQIIAAKSFQGGQCQDVPRVILVHEYILEEFTTALMTAASKIESEQLTESNFAEATKFIDSANLSYSGATLRGSIDRKQRKMGITVITDVSVSSLPAPKAPIIALTRFSSLDDAIDTCNKIVGNQLSCAKYLFANSLAAKYISQFTKPVNTYINHIPIGLLMGRTPIYGKAEIVSRYPASIFARIGDYSTATAENSKSSSHKGARELSSEQTFVYETQLRPLQQREGARTDFFVQGIKVMMGTVALGMAGGVIGIVFAAFKAYRSYVK